MSKALEFQVQSPSPPYTRAKQCSGEEKCNVCSDREGPNMSGIQVEARLSKNICSAQEKAIKVQVKSFERIDLMTVFIRASCLGTCQGVSFVTSLWVCFVWPIVGISRLWINIFRYQDRQGKYSATSKLPSVRWCQTGTWVVCPAKQAAGAVVDLYLSSLQDECLLPINIRQLISN